MNVYDFLETTAQIAVTFAGFISIFLILARQGGSLEAEIASLIRFILLGSIASLFAAVFPLIAAATGLTGEVLWRVSGVVGLAAGAGLGVFGIDQRRRIQNREVTVYVRAAWTLVILVCIAFAANIAAWPLSPNGGVHLTGIWCGLAVVAINLTDLVMRFALKRS